VLIAAGEHKIIASSVASRVVTAAGQGFGIFARRCCGRGWESRFFASAPSHHRSKVSHWSTASQHIDHAMPTLALAQFDLGRRDQAAWPA